MFISLVYIIRAFHLSGTRDIPVTTFHAVLLFLSKYSVFFIPKYFGVFLWISFLCCSLPCNFGVSLINRSFDMPNPSQLC